MKRKELQWWDVIVISVILFGFAIYNSTMTVFHTSAEVLEQGTVFTSADNWFGIASILVELTIAYLYLRLRRFDFSQWHYKITWKDTLLAIGLFLLMSVVMDAADVLVYGWAEATAYVGEGGFWVVIQEMDLSLILFSLLNGTYEEIFFLGVCMVVTEKQRPWVLLYSLLIRFSFHTYQGMASALEIGFIIGLIYLFFYSRKTDRNLYPFMLSHAFADIFGAGILTLL